MREAIQKFLAPYIEQVEVEWNILGTTRVNKLRKGYELFINEKKYDCMMGYSVDSISGVVANATHEVWSDSKCEFYIDEGGYVLWLSYSEECNHNEETVFASLDLDSLQENTILREANSVSEYIERNRKAVEKAKNAAIAHKEYPQAAKIRQALIGETNMELQEFRRLICQYV